MGSVGDTAVVSSDSIFHLLNVISLSFIIVLMNVDSHPELRESWVRRIQLDFCKFFQRFFTSYPRGYFLMTFESSDRGVLSSSLAVWTEMSGILGVSERFLGFAAIEKDTLFSSFLWGCSSTAGAHWPAVWWWVKQQRPAAFCYWLLEAAG